MISRKDLAAPRRASLVLHSWLEVVAEDIVREVFFGGGGVVVEEQHPVPMHVLDRGHVCLDLAEEDGDRLGVSSVVVGRDDVIQRCFCHKGEERICDGDELLVRYC